MEAMKKTCAVFLVCVMILSSTATWLQLVEKQKDAVYFHQYNQVLKQEQDLLKKKITQYQDLADASKVEKTNAENKFNFIVPQEVDTSSILIFLEEYALLNDVTVSKVDLHKEKENGTFTSLGITFKPISVEVVGNYTDVMGFLADIQNNMGVANYIDNLVIQGIDVSVIAWNDNDSSDEGVSAHFQIFLGSKKKEGEGIE